ncbi:MAG: glycosyltransferase family 4 protein [Acidobacteriota bacterium]
MVNYEAVRQRFDDQYGPGAEVRNVPYASEAAFLHAETKEIAAPPAPLVALRPADAPLIVSVSRHDPRKGIPVLLRALAELRDAGVRFRACLVSGGEYFDASRRLAEQLRLGDQVVLTGWVPDPFDYLQHADVFVLPSLQEGSGSVALLEALQAGAAIVASDLDGIPEDVTDGESALLVEPGNVNALSRALRQVVTDTALRERLRQRARATYEARFSAEALTVALRDIYAEMGFTAASD